MPETEEELRENFRRKAEALRIITDKYARETTEIASKKLKDILKFILKKTKEIKETENDEVASGYMYGSINLVLSMTYNIMKTINPTGAYVNAKMIIEETGKGKTTDKLIDEIFLYKKRKGGENTIGYG